MFNRRAQGEILAGRRDAHTHSDDIILGEDEAGDGCSYRSSQVVTNADMDEFAQSSFFN